MMLDPAFMSFDWANTPEASWRSDISNDQKLRLGKKLTQHDLGLFKEGGKDAMHHMGLPVNQSDIDNFTFRYWFNYFWEEAVSGSAKDDVDHVIAALNCLLERKKFPIPLKSKFVTGAVKYEDYYKFRAASDSDRCSALEHLLQAAFTGMRRFIGPLQPDLVNMPFMEEVYKDATESTPLFTREAKGTQVYWRGEARAPEMVMQQATKRMVDIPFLVEKMNLGKPWNPFHRPEIAANMWYRKGKNKDNDYYTAISVALDFKTACCFPLIDEKRVYNFISDDPWSWPAPEVQKQLANLGVVELAGKRHVQVITQTTVYLSTNRGATVFTRSAQEKISKTSPFPEHAVAEICPADIYGYLIVYRVFHGLEKNQGFTVYIDKPKSSRLRYDTGKQQMYKVAGPDLGRDQLQFGDVCEALEREYTTALNSPKFAIAWAASGHGNAGTPRQYGQLYTPPPLEGPARGFLMNKMKRPPQYS